MKIKTDYFANWRNWDENYVPISLCRFPPKGWNGIEYKDVAPEEWLLEGYKTGNINRDLYIKFYVNMIKNIGRENILRELERLSGGKDVALICYEAPGDFCHRHILELILNAPHSEEEEL